MILTAFLRLSGIILLPFLISSIRLWPLRNGKNAILKLGEKIGRAPLTISRSQALFFVSIVSSLIRLLGVLVYLTIYSIPNMKNARHFLPCPNQCISSFQFSFNIGRMAGQWPVLSSFLHWYQNGGLKAGDSYTCEC